LSIAFNLSTLSSTSLKPPKRIIDYVPPAWIELLNKLEEGEENE